VVQRIKQYLLAAILLAIGYFFASQHIIIHHNDFWLLKKSYLSFEYTFYSVTNKKPAQIMRNDMLRDAGIGDLLVDLEIITEAQKFELERRFDY
jgi:hypothetical protein